MQNSEAIAHNNPDLCGVSYNGPSMTISPDTYPGTINLDTTNDVMTVSVSDPGVTEFG